MTSFFYSVIKNDIMRSCSDSTDNDTSHTHLRGSLSSAMAITVAATQAAPPMSPRIMSMLGEGLMEIPPVSKVTPVCGREGREERGGGRRKEEGEGREEGGEGGNR